MLIRSARFSLAGAIVAIAELTVNTVEAIAAGYDAPQLLRGAFGKDILIHAITSVDNRPLTEKELRERFPEAIHWSTIAKAYERLIDKPALDRVIRQLTARTRQEDLAELDVALPGGSTITMARLTADEEERLDLAPGSPLTILNDKIAASIVRVDGKTVSRDTFDARVELPLASWWLLLAQVYQLLNVAETVPDFLPEAPVAPSTSAS